MVVSKFTYSCTDMFMITPPGTAWPGLHRERESRRLRDGEPIVLGCLGRRSGQRPRVGWRTIERRGGDPREDKKTHPAHGAELRAGGSGPPRQQRKISRWGVEPPPPPPPRTPNLALGGHASRDWILARDFPQRSAPMLTKYNRRLREQAAVPAAPAPTRTAPPRRGRAS